MPSMFSEKCFTSSRIFFVMGIFHRSPVTVAAQRFVLGFLAEEHLLVHIDKAVAYVCQRTAPHTDGMYLAHLVGNGQQAWHGAERLALEVEVQAGHNDSDA